MNTPNRGAIPGLPDDVVVEVSARVGSGRVTPLPVGPLRPDVDALIRTVKDFELLTVEAAVHGDEDAALRALVTNPIGPPMSQAPAVWQRLKRCMPDGWGGWDERRGRGHRRRRWRDEDRRRGGRSAGTELALVTAGGSNHESIGTEKMAAVIDAAVDDALAAADRERADVVASAFGLAGVDWDSDVVLVGSALDVLALPGRPCRRQRLANRAPGRMHADVGHRVERRHRRRDGRSQPLR